MRLLVKCQTCQAEGRVGTDYFTEGYGWGHNRVFWHDLCTDSEGEGRCDPIDEEHDEVT